MKVWLSVAAIVVSGLVCSPVYGGGVKVGTGLSITDGALSATGGSGTDAATVNSLIFAQTY